MPLMSSSIFALRVEHLVLVLREVIGQHVVAQLDLSAGWRFLLAEHADEGRFTRAVGAHEGDAVAALDREADVSRTSFLRRRAGDRPSSG
jgi:hypothetical protein